MTNFKKTVVYKVLEDIESNGAFDRLEKANKRLVSHSLALQARKLLSIDELFLTTKKWFKKLDEMASSVARWKYDRPVANLEKQLISNFFAQILLSNRCWLTAELETGAFWVDLHWRLGRPFWGLILFLINFGTCFWICSFNCWGILHTYTKSTSTIALDQCRQELLFFQKWCCLLF